MIEVRQETLREAIELRRKQDARLAGQQHRSAMLGGASITVGALISAVVASPTAGATSGQVVATGIFAVLLALANGVCWYSVYAVAVTWFEGPDIDELTGNYSNRNDGHRALLDHLIAVQRPPHPQRASRPKRGADRPLARARHLRRRQPSRGSPTRVRINPCSPTRRPSTTKTTTS